MQLFYIIRCTWSTAHNSVIQKLFTDWTSKKYVFPSTIYFSLKMLIMISAVVIFVNLPCSSKTCITKFLKIPALFWRVFATCKITNYWRKRILEYAMVRYRKHNLSAFIFHVLAFYWSLNTCNEQIREHTNRASANVGADRHNGTCCDMHHWRITNCPF